MKKAQDFYDRQFQKNLTKNFQISTFSAKKVASDVLAQLAARNMMDSIIIS